MMQRGISISVKGLVAKKCLGHSGSLQVKANIEFVCHADPAMHLNSFIAHPLSDFSNLGFRQARKPRTLFGVECFVIERIQSSSDH